MRAVSHIVKEHFDKIREHLEEIEKASSVREVDSFERNFDVLANKSDHLRHSYRQHGVNIFPLCLARAPNCAKWDSAHRVIAFQKSVRQPATKSSATYQTKVPLAVFA